MSYPEEFTDGWRVLPDPHYPDFVWRCRLFVLEFCATPEFHEETLGMWPLTEWRWYARDESSSSLLHPRTPEREAVWESLFLNP